jgi:hypothetical protein
MPKYLFVCLLALSAPFLSGAQNFLRRAADAAKRELDKSGKSSSSANQPNQPNQPPGQGGGVKHADTVYRSGRPNTGGTAVSHSAPAPVSKMPDGLKTEPLLKLESGEFIIGSESRIAIGAGSGGSDGSINYSIVTKRDKLFFLHSNQGTKGPVDKVPADWLPAHQPKTTTPRSNLYELRKLATDDNTRIWKHVTPVDNKILVDKKPIYTLQEREMLGAAIIDETTGKYVVIITHYTSAMSMEYHILTNTPITAESVAGLKMTFLLSPFSNEFYVVAMDPNSAMTTLINEKGEKIMQTTSGHIFNTADRKHFIAFEEGKDAGIRLDTDLKWKLGYGNVTGKPYIFSDDGSQWISVSGGGIDFSGGSRVEGGLLPVLRRAGNKLSLHFLQLTNEHEILACSMDF